VIRSPRSPLVSILVLVDVALEHQTGFANVAWHGCFNPCSRGCRSGTNRLLVGASCICRFQSLFSWMSLWNHAIIQSYKSTTIGFNPCSRGCRSGTFEQNEVLTVLLEVSILVLVDVALELWLTYSGIACRDSFNPCSRGCRSGT